MKINVIVVNDHVLFNETLTSFFRLTSDIQVIGQACSATELFRFLEQRTPDLVLLDINMPDISGLECAERLNRSHPQLPLIFLTMNAEESFAVRARALDNVRGYLVKNVHPDTLLNAIRTVAAELNLVGAGISPTLEKLTRQEIAVLRLMLAQLSNEEIAARLSNSVRTIEGHRSNIYLKTGARNLVGIVSYALEQGIMTPKELRELASPSNSI